MQSGFPSGYFTSRLSMRFRLADHAYPFALFATSVGAFGFGRGLLTFLVVAIFWLAIFKQPRPTLMEWIVIAGIIVVLLGLLLPAFEEASESFRITACRGHIGDLAKAIGNKIKKDGALPQAVVRDKEGQPLHSWRVSVLPFMEQQPLFDKYDWTQPWDGPINQRLVMTGDFFACYRYPNSGFTLGQTNFFAILGSQTAWPTDRGLSASELTDGAGNTILLLEVYGLGVPWRKPRDLSFDEALELLMGSAPDRLAHHRYDKPGYFYHTPPKTSRGVHAAFADGTVRFLPVPLPEEMVQAMLTANAGDEVDWDEFERLTAPQLDYAKIYATTAFAVVALWPARRLLRKRPA